MMVAPDLDVPGINAAHCAKPTLIASPIDKSSTSTIFLVESLPVACLVSSKCSAQKIMSPPTIKAHATGIGANKYALMYFPKRSAKTIAGKDATTTCRTKRLAKGFFPKPVHTESILFLNSMQTAKIAPN